MNLSFWSIVILQTLVAANCLPSKSNVNSPSEDSTSWDDTLADISSCCIPSLSIYKGMESELGEFPSLAILHYVNSNGFSTFPCAGTLINKRHILTAAHCVTGAILEKSGKL